MHGNIFIISAPSGAGKTTVIKKLLGTVADLSLAVSFTTRKKRPGEVDGVDYRFVDKAEFEDMVGKGGFVEWAEVHGEFYGTPKNDIDGVVSLGGDILLDIDIQGAVKVKKKYPDAISIFLLPPSLEDLEKRIKERGVNNKDDLKRRLDNARLEMARRHEYDYQVVNDSIDEAVDEVADIIDYYRSS